MKRNIDPVLSTWKTSPHRKVLLVRGPRQVGKTYSVRRLSESFDFFLEVNFELDIDVKGFFHTSLDPAKICEKLTAYYDIPIIDGKTLLFLDEIQACPNALRALRFFHEKRPGLHVVAAGSLLEFALDEIPSFGVGRISSLFMHPMTFLEFCAVSEGEEFAAYIRKNGLREPLPDALHFRALDAVKTYFLVGGLPGNVDVYRLQKDLRDCRHILDELLETFRDDFAKYKERVSVSKLDAVFFSAAHQAGSKFLYSRVSPDNSTHGYNESLGLLEKAGLVHRINHTDGRGIPLEAQVNIKKFKVLPFDIGIYQRMLGLDIAQLLVQDFETLMNKGACAELFVGLHIIAATDPRQRPRLYYWHREAKSSNAEVDYVIQRGNEVIPVEVKAGTKGSMKSMRLFLQEREWTRGIRISQEKLNRVNGITIVPIYCTELL